MTHVVSIHCDALLIYYISKLKVYFLFCEIVLLVYFQFTAFCQGLHFKWKGLFITPSLFALATLCKQKTAEACMFLTVLTKLLPSDKSEVELPSYGCS